MVAMLAFGGTFAYFTATTAGYTGSATLGTVSLKDDAATQIKIQGLCVPGDKLVDNKAVTLTNASDVDTYIFVTFKVESTLPEAAKDKITGTIAGEGWTALTGEANVYYIDAAASTNYTGTVNISISADLAENNHDGQTGEALHYMGKTITVTFDARSIQKSGFNNVSDAYAAVKAQTGSHTDSPAIGG